MAHNMMDVITYPCWDNHVIKKKGGGVSEEPFGSQVSTFGHMIIWQTIYSGDFVVRLTTICLLTQRARAAAE